jgi:NAD(P)-dependent dehydrogenase (short-subunit alcohol dehydrogenase family)
MKLANKVALIIGGNSGIGSATARLFVAEGARVAITGRNPKTLQAAAKKFGDHVLALTADVTDLEATERASMQSLNNGVNSISSSPTPAFTNSPRSAQPQSPNSNGSFVPT